nr:MAG TPA: hypothetical protein [Caudoviricetes sp.]
MLAKPALTRWSDIPFPFVLLLCGGHIQIIPTVIACDKVTIPFIY